MLTSVARVKKVLPRCVVHKRFYQSTHGVFGFRPRPARIPYDPGEDAVRNRASCSNLWRLICAYRDNGHLSANVDPLGMQHPEGQPCLQLDRYGLTTSDVCPTAGLVNIGKLKASVGEIDGFLKAAYCGTVGLDFSHAEPAERDWWANRWEELARTTLPPSDRIAICKEMLRSQAYDNFLATKFSTTKRYGGEGAEPMMAFFLEAVKGLSNDGVEQILIGMAHRGRLNLLTGLLKLPPRMTFQKIRGSLIFPESTGAVGDVLSHLTSSVDVTIDGKSVHVTMLPNPSHLEAVNPVVAGKTRGRQRILEEGDYSSTSDARPGDKAVCVQVHGDAAMAGQGIVQETLALSHAPNFDVGGSLHLVVNNQVGYTTPGERGRSTRYCTDVAKMINAPVVHVNGDCPDSVAKATRLAVDYQRTFRKDVFVDLICFRRWGHNELDDPTFTNPAMYKVINARQSIPDSYAAELVDHNVMSADEVQDAVSEHMAFLADELKQTDPNEAWEPKFEKRWSGIGLPTKDLTVWDTGVDIDTLKFVGAKSVQYPSNFNVHQHLKKTFLDVRMNRLVEGTKLDWATAEALAFGSLLHEGVDIRISGQDVGRGTFSQRHCMLVDQETNEIVIPFNSIRDDQVGKLEVVNAILSEEAVMGFEYGYSLNTPKLLPIWEAQFGDFFNGAQIIIDTFITCGESKWMLQSAQVLLLPHGMDGTGPEHSSCRLERFLQLTDSRETAPDGDDVNFNVAFPTTPAQYFHLLRRQIVRNFRKPLVVASPKVLLRLADAKSDLPEFAPGTCFQHVLDDPSVTKPEDVKTIIFVAGKHYYTLDKERAKLNLSGIAIVRLELLAPFPSVDLQKIVSRYPNARNYIWGQEEHRNAGAWSFAYPRFENLLGIKLRYAGRKESPVPAVGSTIIHGKEVQEVLAETFEAAA